MKSYDSKKYFLIIGEGPFLPARILATTALKKMGLLLVKKVNIEKSAYLSFIHFLLNPGFP
jgi:hypothetical protein